ALHAERRANLAVEGNEREAATEHAGRDQREAHAQPPVCLFEVHRFENQYLAMMPTKNISAMQARTSAVLTFLVNAVPAGFRSCGTAPAPAGASTRARRRLPRASPAPAPRLACTSPRYKATAAAPGACPRRRATRSSSRPATSAARTGRA